MNVQCIQYVVVPVLLLLYSVLKFEAFFHSTSFTILETSGGIVGH
jgi:hypothetical protein